MNTYAKGTLSGPNNCLVQINDLHTPYLNMLMIALYLMFVITLVCLSYEFADIITDWSRHNDMRINARKKL